MPLVVRMCPWVWVVMCRSVDVGHVAGVGNLNKQ